MFEIFDKLKVENNISKKDLMNILKQLSNSISIHDLMISIAILRDEGKYIQKNYRNSYFEVYVKYFIMRIKDIKEDKIEYKNFINKDKFIEAIELLKSQFKDEKLYNGKNGKFPEIYAIIGLYATFILNEPIHPEGTPFPGSLKVQYKNNIYFCPVKDKQKENPNAVCKFCIAEQLDL